MTLWHILITNTDTDVSTHTHTNGNCRSHMSFCLQLLGPFDERVWWKSPCIWWHHTWPGAMVGLQWLGILRDSLDGEHMSTTLKPRHQILILFIQASSWFILQMIGTVVWKTWCTQNHTVSDEVNLQNPIEIDVGRVIPAIFMTYRMT